LILKKYDEREWTESTGIRNPDAIEWLELLI
jgi:hypothetical protein